MFIKGLHSAGFAFGGADPEDWQAYRLRISISTIDLACKRVISLLFYVALAGMGPLLRYK